MAKQVHLENQYAPLDQLDVFLLRGPEILESVKGGEVRLWEKRSYEHRNFNIEFHSREHKTYRLLGSGRLGEL